MNSISWLLTSATEKFYQSQLRQEAETDALQKARDYCEVLGCTKVRPLELSEGDYLSRAANGYGVKHRSAPQISTYVAAHEIDRRDENELVFEPEELKMVMDVTVKFLAE